MCANSRPLNTALIITIVRTRNCTVDPIIWYFAGIAQSIVSATTMIAVYGTEFTAVMAPECLIKTLITSSIVLLTYISTVLTTITITCYAPKPFWA